ncbi:MAG: hypothetical protein A2527_10045 [Candidatus Lambdaproteobacteria bacterium RIFOXYD2_FULL_50_16]|uniref:CobQ/CobB/MinD/ParA nucleotide binding domain-containing protein n=1 Tax=Candidatus Lambdaproteobacteria bacterium RIFOXYD2_FULL_50_16 TaxID=1817772 RepID=A0A1F6G9Y8_9PROT|nr:MAG: hypothetical protein A2527_10045 [Candidatus Lambdaproteobacteria bacterium RIFOXYD2_FULL_50_16]
MLAGLSGSGKTHLTLALMEWFKLKGKEVAAFKPFAVNALGHNANEQASDAELYAAQMTGEPANTLINPYVAQENYPIELAFRRDGIKVRPKLLAERQTLLLDHYAKLMVELPGGLAESVDEKTKVIDWAIAQVTPLFYLIRPSKERFNETLLEMDLLRRSQVEFYFAFNNANHLKDGDWLFYQWEKLEAVADCQAEGMLPFEPDPKVLALKLEEYLPKLTGLLNG